MSQEGYEKLVNSRKFKTTKRLYLSSGEARLQGDISENVNMTLPEKPRV